MLKTHTIVSNSFLLVLFSTLILSITSCEKIDNPTPTHELMQGVWEIDEIYNENNENITEKVTSFSPAYLQLDDKNSVNSTCGPLFMYLVYGDNRFINVTSRIDEIFDYADLSLTEGEWFIDKTKEVDVFTCEIKMKFPSANTLESILSDMGGINFGFMENLFEAVIYHKFMDIYVETDDSDPNSMKWIIDDEVKALYNTKDKYGNYLPWTGVPTNNFSHCTIYWKKRKNTINQLIQGNK